MGQRSSGGANDVYNMVSIFFVAMAGFVCLIALLITGEILPAGPLEPATDVPEPTSIGEITATPTDTPEPSATPRDTAEPGASPTWTPFPTQTSTATITPSNTPIPSATATFTQTAIPSDTPTPTLGPTDTPLPTVPAPTLGPPAVLQYNLQAMFIRDAFTHPDCDWQGVAGNITTSSGQPVPNIWVRVVGSNFDEFVISGSTQAYGTLGGYEIQTNNAPTPATYQIQLYGADQVTALSNAVPINMDGTCTQNLAVVNFVQISFQ